ncbi:MAG: hypothetical protein E7612_04485 [Ruminococcaceae bacterium]|nr:hypothetical protein [Oscillospiraceae bacterium]
MSEKTNSDIVNENEIDDIANRERIAAQSRIDGIKELCNSVIRSRLEEAESNGDSADNRKASEEKNSSPTVRCEEKDGRVVLTVLPGRIAVVKKCGDTPPPQQTENQNFTSDAALCKDGGAKVEPSEELYGKEFQEELDGIYPDADLPKEYTERTRIHELSDRELDYLALEERSEEYADEEFVLDNDAEYKYGTDSAYARNEFSKRTNSFFREENLLKRRISKIEDRQKEADNEKNISLIVEKIGVQKEICELTVELLGSCVYVKAKGKTARYKRLLKSHIDTYNRFCDEYEAVSGRPLECLEYSMIDDVLAGKICRPIPTVYYYGMEDDAVYNPYDEANDRARRLDEEEELIRHEWERYVEGGSPMILSDGEKKALAHRTAEKMSQIKRATERDVLLVGLRSEYALAALEAKKDFLVRSYGLDKRKNLKAIKDIDRKIDKINRNAKRAVETEREDNSRFYLLKALDPANEKLRQGARRERLDALRMRLDILLSERESVNERLIALYGGSNSNLKSSKIIRKAANIRKKSATAMYKKQRKLAKKIDGYKVPSNMKERAFDLLNKKTQAVATADELYYKLRHLKPQGRAKRELVLEIRCAKKTARRLDREIRYMLRKLRRNQERAEDNKEWASVIAFAAVVLIIAFAVWYFLGDGIAAYFDKLLSQLRGV